MQIEDGKALGEAAVDGCQELLTITQSGLCAVWTLSLDKDQPMFHYSFWDAAHYEVAGRDALTPGIWKRRASGQMGTPV